MPPHVGGAGGLCGGICMAGKALAMRSPEEPEREITEITQSQANAARGILENFGPEKAMGYLIGEKFLNFLEVAEERINQQKQWKWNPGYPQRVVAKDETPFLQRRPLAFHPLPLNLSDLTLVYPEAFDDQPAGLGHVHLVVLGVHKGQENLFAAVFGKRLVAFVLGHGTPLLVCPSHREGDLTRQARGLARSACPERVGSRSSDNGVE
jgi:hypothetical protein